MEVLVNDKPNPVAEVVPVKEANTGLDAIAAKMTAMRNVAERNRPQQPEQVGTGNSSVATDERPVAPEGVADSDTDLVEPEVAVTEVEDDPANDDTPAPEEVSDGDSTSADIIDFRAEITAKQSHSGLKLCLGLLGFNVDFNIYDTRHWADGKWVDSDSA